MNNAIALKADTIVSGSAIGLNKYIVNFPGGVQELIPAGTETGNAETGLVMKRHTNESVFKIRTFDGRLLTLNNNFIPDTFLDKKYTDELGNVVRDYSIDVSYAPSQPLDMIKFHLEVGVTRIEVLNFSEYQYNDSFCAWKTGQANPLTEGISELGQYALIENAWVRDRYVPAQGDLKVFKDYKSKLNINVGGTNITGNISNLKEAAKIEGSFEEMYFPYCTGVYGELTTILDAMKTRSDILGTGKTFNWYFYNTQVTYKGNLINQGGGRQIVFDAEGNYTVDGI